MMLDLASPVDVLAISPADPIDDRLHSLTLLDAHG
jgi:hypothetical protein